MQSFILFSAVLATVIQAIAGHPNGSALQERQEYQVQEPKREDTAYVKELVPGENINVGTPQSNKLYVAKQLTLDPDGKNTCGKYSCPDKEYEVVTHGNQIHSLCTEATQKCECWGVCVNFQFPFGLKLGVDDTALGNLYEVCRDFCRTICHTVVDMARGTNRNVRACLDMWYLRTTNLAIPTQVATANGPDSGASTEVGNDIADSSVVGTELGTGTETETETEIGIDNDNDIQ